MPYQVVQRKLKFCNIMRCILLTLKVAGYLEKIQTHYTTNSLPQSTKVGGISGASIDYSTSYCGSLSQHINLNAIPDGRVVLPPLMLTQMEIHTRFLNFAYKLTPNSRATLLLGSKVSEAENIIHVQCC